jgi:hypothetical protein
LESFASSFATSCCSSFVMQSETVPSCPCSCWNMAAVPDPGPAK